MPPEESDEPRKRPRLRTHRNPRKEPAAPLTANHITATALRAGARLSPDYRGRPTTPHDKSSEQPDDDKPTNPA